jgi:hypothetical protein
LPDPLLIFISNLIKDEQYIPNNFMTLWEMDRLFLTEYGALMNVTEE